MTKGRSPRLTFRPLTRERWPDLESLFGERGAYGGCWCMWWRLAHAQFDAQAKNGGPANKRAFKKIVTSGAAPGVLAYEGKRPVGWCAVQPREAYPALDRSRDLKRIDEQPVWSITCFFIDKAYRGRGLMSALLEAAVGHAAKRGARIIEGYPVDSAKRLHPGCQAFRGAMSAYRDAGFVEAERRSPRYPIMRYTAGRRGSQSPCVGV